jgi:hypothetical protein
VLVTLALPDFDVLLSPSSGVGSVATLWTTMLGVPLSPGFLGLTNELFRDLEEGDGDFNLGEVGHEGGSLGAASLEPFRWERGIREDVSVVIVGCSWGTPAPDRARCIAAAEGTVERVD